jgi:hypothetical protein
MPPKQFLFLTHISQQITVHKQLLGLFAFLLCFGIAYIYFSSLIVFEVELNTDSNGIAQIFYAGRSQDYTEKRSFRFRTHPKKTTYRFILNDLMEIKRLSLHTLITIRKIRIDPLERAGKIRLRSVLIEQMGCVPLRFETSDQLRLLKPANARADIQSEGILITSSGNDPQLELPIRPRLNYMLVFTLLLSSLLSACLLIFFFGRISEGSTFQYTPYMMMFIMAFMLATAMGTSKGPIHADEGIQMKAGRYYIDHWMPPGICDPAIADTYSVYGASRLEKLEIVYFLAGKFVKVLQFTELNDFIKFRLFNIFLFFILTVLCIRNADYRVLTLPLLISPQIWYVFTYFNSEAFAMFILILVSYQVFSTQSMMNRLLAELGEHGKVELYLIVLGLLFSLLLLIKTNFYIFIIFLTLCLLLKLYRKAFPNPLMALKRIGVIILISASVFGLRYSVDLAVNGGDRRQKYLDCVEKMARPMYKPSNDLSRLHLYMRLRDRGVSFKEMFIGRNWGTISFCRAFGIYFFKPIAPDAYYKLVLATSLFFGAFIFFSILFNRNIDNILLSMIVLVSSLLLIGLSFWHSWTVDFQAHGRYLFPIFSMIGVLIFQSIRDLNKPLFNFFVIFMFIVSSYSYIFIGFLQLLEQ